MSCRRFKTGDPVLIFLLDDIVEGTIVSLTAESDYMVKLSSNGDTIFVDHSILSLDKEKEMQERFLVW